MWCEWLSESAHKRCSCPCRVEHPGGPSRRTDGGQRRLGRAGAVKAAAAEGGGCQASLYSGDRPSHPHTEGRWPGCERSQLLNGPTGGAGCCKAQRHLENANRAVRNAPTVRPAGYFCAAVASFRFLSAADAIAVRFTASELAHRRRGASGVGRPVGAIRPVSVAGPFTRTGTAGIALDGKA